MADGDPIAVAWVKAKIQLHGNYNLRAIDMTNAESPLAATIRDNDLGIAFNHALGKFLDAVTGTPKEGNTDDEMVIIELTMACLYKEMGNIKRFNEILVDIKESMVRMYKRRNAGPAVASLTRQQLMSKESETEGMMPKAGDPTDYDQSSGS